MGLKAKNAIIKAERNMSEKSRTEKQRITAG